MQVVEITRPLGAPYYSPSSIFNRPLSSADTLAADQTPAYNLANQAFYGYQGSAHNWRNYVGPGYGGYQWPSSLAFNIAVFSHPVFVVTNADPKMKVGMYYSGGGSYHALGTGGFNLQSFMNAVPIPDKTKCPKITGTAPYVDIWAGGSDQSCCIWNRDTDEMWEFWVMNNAFAPATAVTGTAWTAQWGGYTPSASTFNGIFPYNWGSRACSLGEIGGLITMQDLRNVQAGGTINHAIAIAAPYNSESIVAPATRADGTPGGNFTPHIPAGFPGAGGANPAYGHDGTNEAQRFRFPANVDLSALNRYPLGREIGRAISIYGMLITDTSEVVTFYMEDDRTVGSKYHMQGANAPHPWDLTWPGNDPRYGGAALSSGWTVLNQLPWDQLQVLTPVAS